MSALGGVWSQRASAPGGGWGGAWWRLPGTATAAGGTHPTGIHSCYVISITRTITNPSPREIVDMNRST